VKRVECRQEELAVGERCQACGRGRWYRLPQGIEMGRDGKALLSAVRYAVEKLRCSAGGQGVTAPLPAGAGEEKYRARARAVLALGRYYLGGPWYRVAGYQALVGVPVPEATQGDQIEHVADGAYPVFKPWEEVAAPGAILYQDATGVRILSVIEETRQAEGRADPAAPSPPRTGM
jgi:transposase